MIGREGISHLPQALCKVQVTPGFLTPPFRAGNEKQKKVWALALIYYLDYLNTNPFFV
jgi:hypothetical protein